MTDQQLDQLLRERLQQLDAAGTGRWDALERALDRHDATDFDATLGAALGGLDAGVPTGWDALSERLNQTEAEDDFDAAIAGALGGLTAGAAAGWASLDAHLDELDATEAQNFDQTVRDHIQDYSVGDAPNHWPQMERQLNRTFGLRQRIRRWRLVETALVALLLLALAGTFQNQERFELGFPEFIERIWTSQPVDATTPSEPIAVLPAPPVAVLEPTTVFPNPATDNGRYPSETISTAQLPAAIVSSPPTEPSNRMERGAIKELDLPRKQLPALNTTLTDDSENEPTEAATAERPGLLARLGTLFPKKVKEERRQKPLAVKVNPRKEKPHLRVGMVGLGDYSLVSFEPVDRDLKAEITQRNSQSYGYGGGLTLGFMYDRFEFETGAIYGFRTYSPNHTGRTFGSFNRYVQEWLRRVSYETVEIPANIRFNVYHKRDWRIYGGFGLSLNTVLTSTYDVKIESSALEAPGGETPPPSSPDETKSTLADLVYPRGLLEGGDFWTNSYLTFNLNAGVETHINPRISLYLQPSFSHSLRGRGYGPLQDRFDTFSLRFGTKVTVW